MSNTPDNGPSEGAAGLSAKKKARKASHDLYCQILELQTLAHVTNIIPAFSGDDSDYPTDCLHAGNLLLIAEERAKAAEETLEVLDGAIQELAAAAECRSAPRPTASEPAKIDRMDSAVTKVSLAIDLIQRVQQSRSDVDFDAERMLLLVQIVGKYGLDEDGTRKLFDMLSYGARDDDGISGAVGS